MRSSGVTLGRTPLPLSDTNIVMNPQSLTLELDGYEPASVVVQRDQWNSNHIILSVIGGICCFAPYLGLLWSADYRPQYDVELKPLAPNRRP